jgi:hypothetical protein
MKIEIKRSILNWIKKLLHYDETKDTGLHIIKKEERQIECIRHTHIYCNQELNMLSDRQIRFAAGLAIVEVLNCEDMGKSFISYTKEPTDEDHTKVTAKLKVILS